MFPMATPRQLEEQRQTIVGDDVCIMPLSINFNDLNYTISGDSFSWAQFKKQLVRLKRCSRFSKSTLPHATSKTNVLPTTTILHQVTGSIKAGKLTAIMGPSGAGKTSLLNALAGKLAPRHRGLSLTGTISINEHSMTASCSELSDAMRQIAGFVYQDDLFLTTMTVEEAVYQAILLRTKNSGGQRRKRVKQVLSQFLLDHAASTKISSISGGERKRTSIAMEVACEAKLLFLDEPTSGLDTLTAFTVIQTLHNLTTFDNRSGLSTNPTTIIMTIHQPSSEIFHLIDELVLLAHGKVVYSGPACNAVDYFARLDYQCPPLTNPADFFFMQVLNSNNNIKGRVEELAHEWWSRRAIHGHENNNNQEILEAKVNQDNNDSLQTLLELQSRYQAPFLTQLGYLLGRSSKHAFRSLLLFRLRLLQTVSVALFVGLSFHQVALLSPHQRLQNTCGVLFFMAMNQFFSSATSVMTIFARERDVVFRELGVGYYGLTAYYLAKILVEIPYQVLFPSLFVLIIYALVGLKRSIDKLLLTMVSVVMASLCGTSLGTLIASIFVDLQVALAVLPVILLPLVLYSGFLLNGASVPRYLTWIRFLSPTQYALTALFKTQFSSSPPERSTESSSIDRQALANFNMQDTLSLSMSIWMMVIIYLVCTMVSYLVLLVHFRRKNL